MRSLAWSATGPVWAETLDNLLNTNKLNHPKMENTFNMSEQVRDVKRAMERENA